MGSEGKCQTLSLFDAPRSRNADSITSFQAAEKLRSSGKWRSQQKAVLVALQRNPGSTSAELAKEMEGDRYIPSRRLPELERDGLVRRGTVRVCRVTKNRCLSWWALNKKTKTFLKGNNYEG